MKVVIEISKSDYEYIKKLNKIGVGECLIDNVYEDVRKGIVLPEGHGRLIDADDCKKNKRDFCEESTRTNWYDIIDDLLDDAPTIIEADKEREDGERNI